MTIRTRSANIICALEDMIEQLKLDRSADQARIRELENKNIQNLSIISQCLKLIDTKIEETAPPKVSSECYKVLVDEISSLTLELKETQEDRSRIYTESLEHRETAAYHQRGWLRTVNRLNEVEAKLFKKSDESFQEGLKVGIKRTSNQIEKVVDRWENHIDSEALNRHVVISRIRDTLKNVETQNYE